MSSRPADGFSNVVDHPASNPSAPFGANKPLVAEHVEYFTKRGIKPTYLKKMACSSAPDGIHIPYPRPDGTWLSNFWRKRLLPAPPDRKFKQPAANGATEGEDAEPRCYFYFAPFADSRSWKTVAVDSKTPLYTVEGEIKAAAIAQIGFAAIGTGGVWNWRQDKHPIRDFALLEWRDRKVIIVVDADAMTNRNVQMAVISHYAELAHRHADVGILVIPDLGGGKTGADDFIAAKGAATFTRLPVRKLDDPAFADWGLTSDPGATDTGNAHRFVLQHGDRVRYVHEWKTWLIWNGHHWRRDDTEEIWDATRETVRRLHREWLECVEEAQRTKMRAWAIESESARRTEALLRVARTDVHIRVSAAQLDLYPHLLTVANGVLDLRTGELMDADPRWLLTKRLHVSFDPKATCPRFKKFVLDVMQGDKSMVTYLQRVLGYTITGDTREQCFFIWHGVGSNGKSTLLNIMVALLGEFARTTRMETWVAQARSGSGASEDIARLHGARLVSAVESEEEQRLAESLIKELTGQDRVNARGLYEKSFEYAPQFKLIIVCNHKPIMRGDDAAIWRRIRLVPFERVFSANEQDKGLIDELKAELPGILNWALEGCLDWQKGGLAEPQKVTDAAKEYRSASDVLEVFFDECCEVGPEFETTRKALYFAYTTWTKDNGHRSFSSTKFSQRLTDRGFRRVRRDDTMYLGVRLKQTVVNAALGIPADTTKKVKKTKF